MLRNTTICAHEPPVTFMMIIYRLNVTNMPGGSRRKEETETIIELQCTSLLSRQWTMKRKVPCWEFKMMNRT